MEVGETGVVGSVVQQPVVKDSKRGSGSVTILHQFTEGLTVMGRGWTDAGVKYRNVQVVSFSC